MEIKEFSFIVFTYKQRDIIIETLESIKYQIVNYGKGTFFDLVIIDDCSNDGVEDVINKWIKDNKAVFRNIVFDINKTNKGTVYTYNKCMNAIKTDDFRLIAGDDLYGPSNIFESMPSDYKDLMTHPYMRLDEGKAGYKESYLYDYFYTSKKYNSNNTPKWERRGNLMHTASTQYSKKLYLESEASEFNSKFKIFEDDPTFYTIFKNIKGTRVLFSLKPQVLYRFNLKSVSHTPNKIFENDWKNLQDVYLKDTNGLEKLWINIRLKGGTLFNILRRVRQIYRIAYVNVFCGKEFREFKTCYKSYIDDFQKHYDTIHKINLDYLKELNKEIN